MNDNLIYDNKGLDLTSSFEGFRAKAYQDQGGVWTVGYGHTGDEVIPGLVVSRDLAYHLLAVDVRVAEKCVKKLVKVPISQGVFDALVDFVFNVGTAHFANSALLKLLNAGNTHAASLEFDKWTKVAGVANKGLATRRLAEKELFLHGLVEATS